MNDLDLSIEEIQQVVEFAHNDGKNADSVKLAMALECLGLCMLRLKIDSEYEEIPVRGPAVDEYYDRFGQNSKFYAAQLQTPAKLLGEIVGIE